VIAELGAGWSWASQKWALPPLLAVILLSIRVAGVFVLTPIFYAMPMPTTVRVLMFLSLSFIVALGFIPMGGGQPVDSASVFTSALAELALGATLGLGVLLAFAAFDVAGRLLDIQIGFGIAQVFDPVTRRQVPILTSAFNTFAVLLFFLLAGHHALLRGIAFSVERFPIAAQWSAAYGLPAMVKQVSALFALGFALVAPVVFCLFMVEMALGVVARNLPQMNMFAVGIPVKIIVGLVTLSLWFAGIGGVMTRVYREIYASWDAMLSVQAPGSTPAPEAVHGR
jgi:flagellar biosynthesis protein FliR